MIFIDPKRPCSAISFIFQIPITYQFFFNIFFAHDTFKLIAKRNTKYKTLQFRQFSWIAHVIGLITSPMFHCKHMNQTSPNLQYLTIPNDLVSQYVYVFKSLKITDTHQFSDYRILKVGPKSFLIIPSLHRLTLKKKKTFPISLCAGRYK